MYFLMLFLAIIGGSCFAIQGPINTALGKRISVFQASFISFLGGSIISLIILIFFGDGDFSKYSNLKSWQLIGGLYGLINVCAIIAAFPVLGAALALTTIMLGQLIAGIFIDSFGFFDSPILQVSPLRIVGIATVALGIILIYLGSNKKNENSSSSNNLKRFLMLLFRFAGGVFGAMQSPTNASMAKVIGNWEGTFISFLVGVFALIPISLFANKGRIMPMKGVGLKPWMLIGGAFGVGGIFFSIYTVGTLGTAIQVACYMIGQLTCGLLFDTFGLIQTEKVKINLLRVVGIFTIVLGVFLVTLEKLYTV